MLTANMSTRAQTRRWHRRRALRPRPATEHGRRREEGGDEKLDGMPFYKSA
jgi:hypothetical protein